MCWQWLPCCLDDPNMITIMYKRCVEDCYKKLNVRLCTLIGYYDDIDTWRTTPISKMQMAFQHVEALLVTFPESFLAWRWEQNIICYLTADESTFTSNQMLEMQSTSSSLVAMTFSSLAAMTSLLTFTKSITSELLTLRAKHVSHWLGEVGGSHQTMIRWQCQPLANRHANALEQIITKIG